MTAKRQMAYALRRKNEILKGKDSLKCPLGLRYDISVIVEFCYNVIYEEAPQRYARQAALSLLSLGELGRNREG